MIFPNLELEAIVQVSDKTRLDATKSFKSKGEAAVTLVRIKPEASGSFVTVTGTSSSDWWLDWEYSTDGVKTVTVEITTDGAPTLFTKDISVISVANDRLFSSDADLIQHEREILKYVRAGRNTFKDIHRKAQTLMLDQLDRLGFHKYNGDPITKVNIVDLQEVKEWAVYRTLNLIFLGLRNSADDLYDKKAVDYESKANEAFNRAKLRLDLDDDTLSGDGEHFRMPTPRILRR